MRAEVVAIAGRWLREPVDLLLERDDLLARFLQRGDEPLVLVDDAGQAALRLGESFLELTDLAWRVGELPPQHADFLFEERQLGLQLVRVLLEPRRASLGVVTCWH